MKKRKSVHHPKKKPVIKVDMNIWFPPTLAGILGLILSGNIGLGLTVFVATAAGTLFTYGRKSNTR